MRSVNMGKGYIASVSTWTGVGARGSHVARVLVVVLLVVMRAVRVNAATGTCKKVLQTRPAYSIL